MHAKPFCAHIIATGFGSGRSPFMPGTCGSFVAALVWYMLTAVGASWSFLEATLTILGVAVVGGWAASVELKHFGSGTPSLKAHDPRHIVIDEWLGMFVALSAVAEPHPFVTLTAFSLFRIFDILKPGPIRWLEKLPGAWGIMADDIGAGALAALALLVLQ